jgi:hypothetical protein
LLSDGNPDAYYRTGNGFTRSGAEQHFSEAFSADLVGYYYQQVSGDNEPGAKLATFEGEVMALRDTTSYTFHVMKLRISTDL